MKKLGLGIALTAVLMLAAPSVQEARAGLFEDIAAIGKPAPKAKAAKKGKKAATKDDKKDDKKKDDKKK